VGADAVSPHLARLLKAAGQKAPESRPILELNPMHPLVTRLKEGDRQLADWAQVLLDEAQLAEGGTLDDPAAFVRRVNALLLGSADPAQPPAAS
jgi:molecular chaperone HtpG